MPISEDDLLRYLAARDEERERDIREALPRLERQMREFLAEARGGLDLPALLARMIRETAVAGFAAGWWHAGGKAAGFPKDSVILHEALHVLRGHDDAYPAFRRFDSCGQDGESES